MQYPFEGKRKKDSFDAALLYKKQAEVLRLQGFGMFGRTYFDVVYGPGEMTLYLPPSSVAFYGNPSDLERDYDAGVFLVLEKTLQGIGDPVNPAHVLFAEDLYAPIVVEGGDDYFVIEVNPETLRIDQKRIFHNDQLIGVIEYEDYKLFDGLLLPGKIRGRLPHKNIMFEFRFDSLSMKEDLPQSLFELSPPDSTQWYPLTDLRIDLLL